MKNKNLWAIIIDGMPRKILAKNSDGIYKKPNHKYRWRQSIDFDQYCKNFCRKKTPPLKSVDTIGYSLSNECLYFFEFKDLNKDFKEFMQEYPNIEPKSILNAYRKKYDKYKKDGIILKGLCSVLLIVNKCQNNILDILCMDKKYFVFCKFPSSIALPKIRNWHNNSIMVQKNSNTPTPYGFIFSDFKYVLPIDDMDRILEEEKIQLNQKKIFK